MNLTSICFSCIPYLTHEGMKLPDNLHKWVAFVTGPEEHNELPFRGIAKPYNALNSATFRPFLGVGFFKVNE